jgi:outer membrane murein-binding lipoprotein Lpp
LFVCLFLLSKTSTQVNTLEREVRELREERESAKAEARRLEAEVGEKKKMLFLKKIIIIT